MEAPKLVTEVNSWAQAGLGPKRHYLGFSVLFENNPAWQELIIEVGSRAENHFQLNGKKYDVNDADWLDDLLVAAKPGYSNRHHRTFERACHDDETSARYAIINDIVVEKSNIERPIARRPANLHGDFSLFMRLRNSKEHPPVSHEARFSPL